MFKAQSAMEYLMTYGWAILVIAVVLAILFSIGVFSGGSFLGTSCIAASGYLCKSPAYPHIGTATNPNAITLTIGQNTGATIYNVIVGISPQGATLSNAGFPVLGAIMQPYFYGQPPTSPPIIGVMPSGESSAVTINVPTSGSGWVSNVIGSTFTGYVWINYTTSSCTLPACGTASTVQKVGTLVVKVT